MATDECSRRELDTGMSSIFVKSFKAVTRMLHGGSGSFFGMAVGGKGRVDYKREVGSLLDASVVMAPVQWVQRALPEARLVVKSRKRDGSIDMIDDHPMLELIQKPNPYYADIVLFWGTVLSMLTDGNAYWIIVRNGYKQPAELWYVPHWMMEPKWDNKGDEFIGHYEYKPGGGVAPQKIAPEDVVHFRHGINPRNLRKGIAPLDSAIREIYMDNESSAFVSALLKNMGVPGVVISPKGGAMVPQGDVDATKAWFQEQFGGDNRGKPLVMGAPTDVTPYGFNPQQMNMSESRDVAEERVCALLGIPAAVVGFGSGLQSTKVGATMEEMRKLAWHNGVLPIARLIADELQRSLLPLFPKTQGQIVDWDTDDVRALQEDEDKKTERWNKRLLGGAVTVAEAREAWGLDVDDSHRIYLRPINLIEVPEGEARPEPVALPSPKSRGAKAARASRDSYKRGAAFVRAVQAQERNLQKAIEGPLSQLFTDIGDAAASAAKSELKSAKEDDGAVVEQILSKLGIAGWQSKLKQIYAAHYEQAMNATAKVAADAGLGASVPDDVMRSVIAAGGRRSAMVDLTEQTKAAIFDALAEGRAAGEGADALAKRILGHVEGGPWGTAETRARVIARTETKYAQNISTIERARAGGVDMFIVFDGRLGPGRSKPDHIARDGSIVTAAEADEMAEAEHPNGTLSFAPYFEGME
jgi:HK97 family phage portal protein